MNRNTKYRFLPSSCCFGLGFGLVVRLVGLVFGDESSQLTAAPPSRADLVDFNVFELPCSKSAASFDKLLDVSSRLRRRPPFAFGDGVGSNTFAPERAILPPFRAERSSDNSVSTSSLSASFWWISLASLRLSSSATETDLIFVLGLPTDENSESNESSRSSESIVNHDRSHMHTEQRSVVLVSPAQHRREQTILRSLKPRWF